MTDTLRIKAGLIAAACLAATAVSGTACAGEITHASLERLIRISGTREQVFQIPRLIRIGMDRARAREESIHNPPTMSDSDFAELEATVVDAFRPADILGAVGNAVRKTISEEDARQILAWYSAEPGKRIARAEANAANPEDDPGMADTTESLLHDASRVSVTKRLDDLLHITGNAMRLQLNTAVAMFVVFSTKKNLHAPANLRALKHRFSVGLEKSRPKMQRAVMETTIYTYRNIDMPNLNRYLGFLESPRMTRLNKALRAGMEAGMDQAMDTMARTVSTLLKKQHMQTI